MKMYSDQAKINLTVTEANELFQNNLISDTEIKKGEEIALFIEKEKPSNEIVDYLNEILKSENRMNFDLFRSPEGFSSFIIVGKRHLTHFGNQEVLKEYSPMILNSNS